MIGCGGAVRHYQNGKVTELSSPDLSNITHAKAVIGSCEVEIV